MILTHADITRKVRKPQAGSGLSPKVVTPLADAMCLIDNKERQALVSVQERQVFHSPGT